MTATKIPRATRQQIRHLEEENARLRDLLIEAEERARRAEEILKSRNSGIDG